MAGLEKKRLKEDQNRLKNWKRWGPYLSERQWGTVREDYSDDGDCWNYFPHDHARSRAYRWDEDGMLGITDRQCRLCLALTLWNAKDPILKERYFGLNGHEGNHGEDVKELYYYLVNTPTHSYMKSLYKYPQDAYPYDEIVRDNGARTVLEPEYELLDTGVFDKRRYFDVQAEYCKASPNDILCRYTISNRGPEAAKIHVLPTLWFRNTWSWGDECDANLPAIPILQKESDGLIRCEHPTLGEIQPRKRMDSMDMYIPNHTDHTDHTNHTDQFESHRERDHSDEGVFKLEYDVEVLDKPPDVLFTDNNTNHRRLFGVKNESKFVKDAFHDYFIKGKKDAVNPKKYGTKCAVHFEFQIEAGAQVVIKLRLYQSAEAPARGHTFSEAGFDLVFKDRQNEAEQFYKEVFPSINRKDYELGVQAIAGLLWSKQFYYYIVREWIKGDTETNQSRPWEPRLQNARNKEWRHLFNRDVISMPDKWEYPWYASWDLAFHMIPMSRVDIQFAKSQLVLLLREWFMHPNGQIPAYEFAFDDVNPPVHAYAVLKVYKASGLKGTRDLQFLGRCFHKLILNFTWWVNRKDVKGKNIFSGGFLGLDNIGVFDRSKPLPTGGSLAQVKKMSSAGGKELTHFENTRYIESLCKVSCQSDPGRYFWQLQADATAWMCFFCSIMLEMSLILAQKEYVYQDMASKFFEHFITIVDAMNSVDGEGLWDEVDGFYYDHVRSNSQCRPMKIKSMVGLVPLFCTLVIKDADFKKYPGFRKRTKWFLDNRKDLVKRISFMCRGSNEDALLLSVLTKDKLVRLLGHMLDEDKFLSPYGIRSLSKEHKETPFTMKVGNTTYTVDYEPGESESKLFGGNSNWRGPIWLPMNYLIIENLQRFDFFYGDTLKVECPTGSGHYMRLSQVAKELASRLIRLFSADEAGKRPCHGQDDIYSTDPHFKDLVLFYEYFHGDTGRGCGASHQTGWTALIANLLDYVAVEEEDS